MAETLDAPNALETLKQLYETYAAAAPDGQRRSLGDAFRGWFGGRDEDPAPVDAGFMDSVDACTEQLRESGEPGAAYEAVKLIMSLPRSKKFSRRDLVFAAMHAKAIGLVPQLSPAERAEVLALMEDVPRPYRFPVYKKLKQALEAEDGPAT